MLAQPPKYPFGQSVIVRFPNEDDHEMEAQPFLEKVVVSFRESQLGFGWEYQLAYRQYDDGNLLVDGGRYFPEHMVEEMTDENVSKAPPPQFAVGQQVVCVIDSYGGEVEHFRRKHGRWQYCVRHKSGAILLKYSDDGWMDEANLKAG
jgi:hypothetical protein